MSNLQKDAIKEEGSQKKSEPILCLSCFQFYGTPATDNLCSKCYKFEILWFFSDNPLEIS